MLKSLLLDYTKSKVLAYPMISMNVFFLYDFLKLQSIKFAYKLGTHISLNWPKCLLQSQIYKAKNATVTSLTIRKFFEIHIHISLLQINLKFHTNKSFEVQQ